ncbi:MAG: glycosyltransferase [Candidatus Niyogibacteria bacterium]|nr:MAG: glycosyltransferase [Candidatus Niyogibacteria bacterium]
MKILMFSADPTILDKESSASRRMVEYGRRVERLDVLVLTSRAAVKQSSGGGVAGNVLVRAFTGKFMRFPKAFFAAWRALKSEKYDLLTAQDIEHAFICRLLSKSFKVKWQMQIHADIFSPFFTRHSMFNKMRAMLAKFLIPRASCIRVVSERIKKSIIRKFNNLGGKIIVLPILAESADLNVEPKVFPEFDKTILMVSRLTSEKNIGLALDAIAEVIKGHPKTGLIIVGDGSEREALELKADSLQLTANIKFEGWQKNTAQYYKGANIFLLTSRYEGWGMSAVEAMRYGAAVVMADVGLAGEFVEDGKNGLIIPVNDKDALVAAILRLLENDELRRDLAEAAAEKVKKLASEEDYYGRIVESWKKCSNF